MGWQWQVGGGGGGGLVPVAAVVYGSELGISSVDEPKNRVRKDIRMSMGLNLLGFRWPAFLLASPRHAPFR